MLSKENIHHLVALKSEHTGHNYGVSKNISLLQHQILAGSFHLAFPLANQIYLDFHAVFDHLSYEIYTEF